MGDMVRVKMDASGRLVVPKALRDALGMPNGGDLTLSVEDGALRGITRMEALRQLQAKLRGTVPQGYSVVDELLADRRAEAAREEAEHQAWEAAAAVPRRDG